MSNPSETSVSWDHLIIPSEYFRSTDHPERRHSTRTVWHPNSRRKIKSPTTKNGLIARLPPPKKKNELRLGFLIPNNIQPMSTPFIIGDISWGFNRPKKLIPGSLDLGWYMIDGEFNFHTPLFWCLVNIRKQHQAGHRFLCLAPWPRCCKSALNLRCAWWAGWFPGGLVAWGGAQQQSYSL